ncbi:hypothetical protein EOL94_01015 [bacterium]|nr:hypothetical protein [bacterium]
MKQKIKILDLHQKTKLEAEKELEDFFILANNNNFSDVEIITGWGSSSDLGQPVLYNYVGSWLKDKGYFFEGKFGSYKVNLKGNIRKRISN